MKSIKLKLEKLSPNSKSSREKKTIELLEKRVLTLIETKNHSELGGLLQSYAEENKTHQFCEFINRVSFVGTPLHFAIQMGSPEIVELLLLNLPTINPSLQDYLFDYDKDYKPLNHYLNATPLHKALTYLHLYKDDSAKRIAYTKIVEMLIKNKQVDLTILDYNNRTPKNLFDQYLKEDYQTFKPLEQVMQDKLAGKFNTRIKERITTPMFTVTPASDTQSPQKNLSWVSPGFEEPKRLSPQETKQRPTRKTPSREAQEMNRLFGHVDLSENNGLQNEAYDPEREEIKRLNELFHPPKSPR